MNVVLALVAASLLAASPDVPTAPQPDLSKLALARVNGDPVTVQEVLAVFNDRHSGHSKFLGGDLELRKFLNIVLDDKLLVQEAYEIGLDQDPLVLDTARNTERNRVLATLIAEEIDGKARPTDADVDQVWQTLDTIRQVRQITVGTRAEAEEIRAAILRGADPDWFARNCSTARSSRNGGHAMANWGVFSEDWETAVFPLQAGDLSPVIETPEGFDVVIVENRVDVPRPELAKVKQDIEQTLYKRRLEARKRDYSAALFARYHVQRTDVPLRASELATLFVRAPETVLATWNGGQLTLSDTFRLDELQQLSLFPQAKAREEIENRIRVTLNEPLVVLDGVERKIGERPAIVDEVAKATEYTMEALLYRDHVFKDLAVADEEIAAYYQSHKAEFEAPAQRRVAQILVANEGEAKAILEKVKQCADFEELAKQSSRDFVTAPKGGDLGWITADKVPPAFAAILELPAGGVSPAIHDSAGWHVVRVMELKEKQQRALDEVRQQVKDRVFDNKKRAARAAWVDKLRAASKIEVDDAAIRQFVAANEFDEKKAPPQHSMQ
jgi:peptidyl-prolyl cis-trans isomerase C